MCGYTDRTLTARSAEDAPAVTRNDNRLTLSPSLAQLAAELDVRAPQVEAPRLVEDAVDEREPALAG
jgi:hypothetical protein